jgi:ABC-type spermidine/putrescine transport system permease subunit I
MIGAITESRRVISKTTEQVSEVIRSKQETGLARWLLSAPALVAILLLVVIPGLWLAYYSFLGFEDGSVVSTFTLEHYSRVLLTDLYQGVFFRTVRIALVTTVATFLIGYPLAYAAVRSSGWKGRVIIVTTLAPMTIDMVIRAFGWFILLTDSGLVMNTLTTIPSVTTDTVPDLYGSELGIIIGMTHIMLPLMVFPLISALNTVPYSLEEAARNLGANRLEIFWKILLPLTLPGVAAGILIVFTVTLAAFVTPSILGGGTDVLAIVIQREFLTTANWPFGSAVAMLLVVTAFLVIIGYQRVLERLSTTEEI